MGAWLSLSSVCGTACTGQSGEQPEAAALAKDAGVIVAADGALVPAVTDVTVHVVGLSGSGLIVRVGASDDYSVAKDGLYRVTLATPVDQADLLVLVQPDVPAQTCEVDRLGPAEFALTCVARMYQLTGTVEGLSGNGLVLTSQTGETLAISASGQFTFEQLLADDQTYSVTASGTVTEPRQTCMVSNGTGVISDADAVGITVTCATDTYSITTNVSGLTEAGLEIKVTDGTIIPVPLAGTFKYDIKFPDQFQYILDIYQQPTTGNQRCYAQDGHGKIDGADATINIICGALGGMHIAEVGSCPFSSSSCWFEVINVNPQKLPDQLGFYKVRTTAIGPKAFEKEHIFDLPFVTIPYLGRVVVQASTGSALPDGGNVVHVADDGSVVPWWTGDGFVELLRDDVFTTDFVRFGKNTTEPLTGGTWQTDTTGSAAPALPIGANAYGSSIAHVAKLLPISSPDDWALHAFSTYGGLNDVTTDVDADADGIPDTAEVSGATFSGIDVYSMGARLGQKDVFVEIDRMDSADPAVIPRKEALDKLVSVYKGRGIYVHFDVGTLYSPSFDPSFYNLGGGNIVPFSKGIGLGASAGEADLYAIKAVNMPAPRRSFFYYQLFAWSQQADGSGGSSGIGELPGNDSIVTLGGFSLNTNNKIQTNLLINYQAATVMHELGHNLGLRHGGADEVNRKPNYVSVMNYLYSPLGLPNIGTTAEGDRYDIYEKCSVTSVQQLTNSPTGDVTKFVIDYSDGLSVDLDENALLEAEGLGRTNSDGVDYNCNGKLDSKYTRDLNADGALNLLSDNDDWASLNFIFRRTVSGSENGASINFLNPGLNNDVCTADAQFKTDLPCGQLDHELLAKISSGNVIP